MFNPYAVDPAAEAFLAEIADADWISVGEKNYPPQYFFALGRYRAHPADVERMRAAIGGLPRVEAGLYDILFNSILLTWDVVKWCPLPDPLGKVGGVYYTRVMLEPLDVYSIPARERDPSTLGEYDWTFMRRRCVSSRGTGIINDELEASQQERINAAELEREAAEHDLAGYMRRLLVQMNDETGYGNLPPEEMARRTGTQLGEWLDTPTEDGA